MNHRTGLEQSSSFGDEESTEAKVIDNSNEESPPKLFKLDIDCLGEIFEYLSMKDLHSLGQTCKTMQQVTGEYFRQNYSAAENFCTKDGIYTVHSSRDGDVNERIQTSAFNQFMPCLSHYYGVLGPLRYLQSHVNEFTSTNHIYLVSLFINHEKIELMQDILPQIETVQIRNCSMSRNFYDLMLKYCVNLKYIYVQNADSSFNSKHEWMLEYYPMLEHFELMPSYPIVVDELETFFQCNSKVKRFSTSARFLWINRNQLLQSNVKLNILEIKAEDFSEYDESGNKIILWDLLTKLHERGFYKRLFLYTDCVDQDLSNKFNSVPGLETLCIRRFTQSYSIPSLTSLKELILLKGSNVNDMKTLANGLVKLERLYVEKATIEDILPFIQKSTRLNKIKLILKDDRERQGGNDDDNDNNPAYKFWYYEEERQHDENAEENADENANADANANANEVNDENRVEEKCITNWRILDLPALNRERAKLPGARKITIFVRDDVFLSTKWAMNGDINLSFIELRRSDSYEWNHHF